MNSLNPNSNSNLIQKISFIDQLTCQLKQFQIQKIINNELKQNKQQQNHAKNILIDIADLNESNNYESNNQYNCFNSNKINKQKYSTVSRWNNKKFDDSFYMNNIQDQRRINYNDNNKRKLSLNINKKYTISSSQHQHQHQPQNQPMSTLSSVIISHPGPAQQYSQRNTYKSFSTRKIPQLKQLLYKLQTPKRKKPLSSSNNNNNNYHISTQSQLKVLTSARKNKNNIMINIQQILNNDDQKYIEKYTNYNSQVEDILNKKGIMSERINIIYLDKMVDRINNHVNINNNTNNNNYVHIINNNNIDSQKKKNINNINHINNNMNNNNNNNISNNNNNKPSSSKQNKSHHHIVQYPTNQSIKLKNSQYQKINRKIINNLMSTNSYTNTYQFSQLPLNSILNNPKQIMTDQKQILQNYIKNTTIQKNKQKDNYQQQFNYFSSNFKKDQMKKSTLTNLLA